MQETKPGSPDAECLRVLIADKFEPSGLGALESLGCAIHLDPDLTADSLPAAVTEHDPDWWNATIELQTVIKGDVPETTLTVSFVHSMDVMWLDAPKLREGDEGIFILHEEFPGGLRPPNLAPFESEDIRPRDDLVLIQKLLKR